MKTTTDFTHVTVAEDFYRDGEVMFKAGEHYPVKDIGNSDYYTTFNMIDAGGYYLTRDCAHLDEGDWILLKNGEVVS